MTKIVKISLIIIGTLSASFLVARYYVLKWIDEIDYGSNGNPKFLGVENKTSKLQVPMWIKNPTPFNVQIIDLKLNLFIDGKYVSDVSSRNYDLIKNQTTGINLFFDVKLSDLINAVGLSTDYFTDPDWGNKTKVSIVGTYGLRVGTFSIRNLSIDFKTKAETFLN